MASFVFISCEKSSGSLGLDLVIDDKAVLGTKREIPVKFFSERGDSITTSKPSLFMAGYLDDPIFGTALNDFAAQYTLSQTNPNFGDNAICDSAKLVINYTGNYYGDTNTTLTFNVNEVLEDLDTSIYSNHVFLSGDLLGTKTFTPRPRTPVAFEDTTIVPSLIIDIDPNWIDTRIIQEAIAGNPAFASNDDFVQYMKGFHISSTASGNCVPYLSATSDEAFLRIYYRESPSDTETRTFDLQTLLGLGGGNTVKFDYANAEFDLDNQDTTDGEEKLYVQSMGGVTMRLNLNALVAYKDSGFIINKAELTFPVVSGTDAYLEPPSNMLLLEERNDIRIFVDDINDPNNHYGGELEYDFFRDGKYVFNISRQIHKYLNTENNINDLVMIPAVSSIKMNRAVLGGKVNPVQKAEFIIYFTRTN